MFSGGSVEVVGVDVAMSEGGMMKVVAFGDRGVPLYVFALVNDGCWRLGDGVFGFLWDMRLLDGVGSLGCSLWNSLMALESVSLKGRMIGSRKSSCWMDSMAWVMLASSFALNWSMMLDMRRSYSLSMLLMCSSSVLNVALKVIRALCRSGWLVIG